MQRYLAVFALVACLALPGVLTAGERDVCLQACEDETVACEAQRCGVGEPAVDTTCGRVCGDRYKQCKANCPQ